MNRRVLISGAGIAGPTLAYWLARYGFEATVVERAPAPRGGGYGVDVREQAVEVAERMGVLDQIQAAATDITGVSFVDTDGTVAARIDMAAMRAKAGSREVELMRGDLAVLLYDLTKADVEYVFGDSVRALEQDDGGVTVGFEQGGRRRYDLVVGADGLHSTIRRLAFGEEAEFAHHQGLYFAIADAEPALGEDRWVTLHNRPGTVAGVYRSGNHAQAQASFMFHSGPLRYDHRDLGDQRRLLREVFGSQGWHVPELLARADTDPDLYFDAVSQVRMPSWSAGRVALVGDAAHCPSPLSGSGSTLAMVGAYRLAGELAAAGGDHGPAFAHYEAGFRAKVESGQSIVGSGIKLLAPRTGLGIRVRNLAARLPILQTLAGVERLMRPKVPEPLPDYRPVKGNVGRAT